MLFARGLGTSYGITETLIRMAPLLIVSAGLLISLRAGVWNIGIDGQFLVGALLPGVVAAAVAGQVAESRSCGSSPRWPGMAGGLLWALVPGILRVRWGLNEIITTLMMNYVALNVTSWLVKGPVKDPDVVPPQTRLIPHEMRLPDIPGTGIHIGLLVGLVVVVLVDDPLPLHRPRVHARCRRPQPAGGDPRRDAGQPPDPGRLAGQWRLRRAGRARTTSSA